MLLREQVVLAVVGVVCVVGVRNAVGSWNRVPRPHRKCVVAVSYSPTPSQVQYHRRLRA